MRIRPNELKNQPRRWHVAEVGQGFETSGLAVSSNYSLPEYFRSDTPISTRSFDISVSAHLNL